ncbi:aldo/keto reductase [Clostridium felsineum]|uniref:aldo/keto reductase n=1 Tax=Clostridium felsineum TaxID=36839 RepID=UPI00098C9739|nr:aldo/keto reductase [Clostridium felsineum]MCR3761456.1 aldo/keto reductase [Clostridium felsineum]URZ16303.1 Glyoxal reductase [Clostridium felsineum DSM 794]
MLDINSCAILNNGVKMPWLGFGTYKIEYENASVDYIRKALEVGYRHIDTASVYGNEPIVGQALKESGIKRNEIFVTSKVWNNKHGYDKTLKAFEDTLERLNMDYLDLYLIHWPKKLNKETWKALERLYKDKRVRAIGVSNFKVHHLKEILEDCEIAPMVNQVEYHPQFQQTELKEFCTKNKIQLEAWGPLMQGKIFDMPLMHELATKYNKTIAQIALRWDLQTGVVTIPKSINENRIKENCDLYDFEISKEDMEKIKNLNTDIRIGHDPDTITF